MRPNTINLHTKGVTNPAARRLLAEPRGRVTHSSHTMRCSRLTPGQPGGLELHENVVEHLPTLGSHRPRKDTHGAAERWRLGCDARCGGHAFRRGQDQQRADIHERKSPR